MSRVIPGSRAFRWAAVGLMLLSMTAVSGLARQPDLDSLKAERTAMVERLIAKGTADSLAAAALLRQFGEESDTGSHALVERAVGLAPERRDLAWLAVRLCNSAPDCDPVESEKHLQTVDPRNAVGVMGDLARAEAKNDVAAVDAALTRIGDSEVFNVYFNPLVVATTPEVALARHPGARKPAKRDVPDAMVEMIGIVAATALPPLQPISLPCKGIALQLEGRLEKCRRAAQTLERADTFIAEGLGLSLQQRLWPEGSPEGRAIATRRRVYQYRLEEFSRLDISSSKSADHPAESLEVRRAHEREQETVLEYFGRAGIPLDPPESWTSRMPPRVP